MWYHSHYTKILANVVRFVEDRVASQETGFEVNGRPVVRVLDPRTHLWSDLRISKDMRILSQDMALA